MENKIIVEVISKDTIESNNTIVQHKQKGDPVYNENEVQTIDWDIIDSNNRILVTLNSARDKSYIDQMMQEWFGSYLNKGIISGFDFELLGCSQESPKSDMIYDVNNDIKLIRLMVTY